MKIRTWEFELISNRITGIDVDKLDYFRRDSFYLGAKNIYIDHELLMNETLILKDDSDEISPNEDTPGLHRLCYPSKYADKVYDVYFSRYKLYKTYYKNLKSNGVDLMVAEIFKKANKGCHFDDACRDLLKRKPARYIRLTDSIIEKIADAYEQLPEGELDE